MQTDQWWGCYDEGWGDELVPEAFAHPAKVAPALSKRIYDHAMTEGWLHEGDSVVDPFGGIGGFALQAMVHGLVWIGVELEARFVDLGNQNIALWRRRYALWPKLGSARLVQGDSRRLAEVVATVDGAVSSPPYAESEIACRQGDDVYPDGRKKRRAAGEWEGYNRSSDGNLGNLRSTSAGFDSAISSPPYVASMDSETNGIDWTKVKKDYPGRVMHEDRIAMSERHHTERRYGDSDGQLGSMPAGDFDAAVSSPPYVSGGHHPDQTGAWKVDTPGYGAPSRDMAGYGKADGQLGQMHEGNFDAAVSSPPYEGQEINYGDRPNRWDKVKDNPNFVGRTHWQNNDRPNGYGATDGQLAVSDNFWSAARVIVE